MPASWLEDQGMAWRDPDGSFWVVVIWRGRAYTTVAVWTGTGWEYGI